MARKTQTQIESTRVTIMESALQTLALNPNASMADIAKAAQVGRATLNRYVSSRKELVIELAMLAIAQTDQACEAIEYESLSPIDALEQTLFAVAPLGSRFAFLVSQPDSFGVPEIDEALARQKDFMLNLCLAGQEEGSLRADLPASWMSSVLDALIYAAWNEISAGQLLPKQAGPRIMQTFTQGCAVPPK